MTKEQLTENANHIALQQKTITALTRQVVELGQCVVCGELDHQDGIRINDKFRCFGCVGDRQTTTDGGEG